MARAPASTRCGSSPCRRSGCSTLAGRARAQGAGRPALVAARRLSRQPGDPGADPRRDRRRGARLARGIRRSSPISSATRSRPTWCAGTAPSAVRAFLKSLVALVKRRASRARWSATPISRRPNISTRRFHRFPLLQRLSARRGGVPPLYRAAAQSRRRPAAGADRVRRRFDARRRGGAGATSCPGRCAPPSRSGVAGTFVFAWTDEWFTGGHLIEDWAFGLVDRERQPKPAFDEVQARYTRAVAAAAAALSAGLGRGVRLQRRADDGAVPRLARDAQLSRITRSSSSMTARRDRTLEISEQFPLLPHHQPGKQGPERRAQCRRRGGDRRDRRLYRQRLRRRPRLADLSRRQDGGGRARRLRRPEFPAARGQSGAGGGRGVAGRPDAMCCSATRSPSTSPAATWRSAATCCCGSAGSTRSIAPPATMSTSAGASRMPATRSASAPPPMVWHFRRNTVKAYIGQQKGYGKAEALVYAQAPVPLQPVRPGEVARPHLWRPVGGAAAVAQAGDLFRRVRPRPVPDAVRAALLARPQFLPLTFEWSVVVAACWRWPAIDRRRLVCGCCTVPLLITWAMCINGALQGADRQALHAASRRARWSRC